ncbi:ribosome maturation factor RimM [Gilvimarinus sp. F26214L]|uniref:ribosome maturation factor RimM n=1 Tax=Gilvimarinus sp. DZF01 TaxID=3461371 RepID=UPI004045A509
MAESLPELIPVGRIGAVYGVRGWVRVQSFTAPPEKIFEYQPWWLRTPEGWQSMEVAASSIQGKRLVAQLSGVDDRERARAYAQVEIAVAADALPPLDEGEYYWHQLEGLRVISEYGGEHHDLGRVERLMETGANDVLVVRGDGDSIDKRERLVPYLPDHTVRKVDLARDEILVDWDPEF